MDVMVDLETLGRRAGCVVLSLGAVAFDKDGLKSEFEMVFNKTNSQLLGLHVDSETEAWWLRQSEAARAVLRQADSATASHPVAHVLTSFNIWLSQWGKSKVFMWGNGSDFDNTILTEVYRVAGIETGWGTYNNRCHRTLKNLAKHVVQERKGVHHNALDDAKTQAEHAIAIMTALGVWK